ncbi:MAG: ATP-dependent helicase [Thermoproteota archaeon]|nr:MAG: ATP-dependent helicase [Candidatus Korarchaeota archaeon]
MGLIEFAREELKLEEALELMNKHVARWFSSRFSDLTPPQRLALKPIKEGRSTLISSPTGTGKTLSAFLMVISALFDLAEQGELEDEIYCLYVSPLRALSNDIYRNLSEPLSEIRRLAGDGVPEVRHLVRTGDTPSSVRQRMLRKPPHILITTPESLAIMLSTPKFRERLRSIRWVIVDEIHSLCENKRGVHLTLSLERLADLKGENPVRIGLSATIHPLEEVAKFLVGYDDSGEPRDCIIVDTSFVKKKDLLVTCPVEDLVHTPAQVVTDRMYRMLAALIKKHRTTLVFTNTRSGTERVVFHLKKLLAEEQSVIREDEIGAHHSSLSREVRLDVEERLKNGELKAVVSSTSLELGIDIGYIDLVAQLGSPKSVTRCLQRVGRSGHRLHDTVKGRLICADRDDLVECTVMVREAYANRLDRARIPRNCLDVLAQHIVGMAVVRKWSVEEAYRLVRRSYCYRNLPREKFEEVLRFLSGGYQTLEKFKVYGKIWYDPEEGVFGRRGKYARVIYTLNVGTIPDQVAVKVYTESKRYIGKLEEEFLERLMPGDRFVLGGKVYEFISARGLKAKVKPAYDMKPTVPSWFSEMLPLSFDLANQVREFRAKVMEKIARGEGEEPIVRWIASCGADEKAARAVYRYIRLQYMFQKAMGAKAPEYPDILVENYVDEQGRRHLIFHTLFGRKANDALSRAYAYLLGRQIRRNIGVAVSDNGFSLIIPAEVEFSWSFIRELTSENIRSILRRAVEKTELMARRFRHVAARSLMILRNYKGHEISVSRQQISARKLLEVCREIDGFPVVEETFREILEDYMDVESAEQVLRKIDSGEWRYIIMPESSVPSPFAHNIVLIGLSDVILMEDKRAMLERLHAKVMEALRKAGAEVAA